METSTTPETTAAGNGTRSDGHPGGEQVEVLNPADGSVIRTFSIDPPERVAEVVARVRAAQPTWEALGVHGRYRWMAQLRDWMLANHEEIADTLQAETGKVRSEAGGEVPYLADSISWYGENGSRFLADEEITPHLPPLRTKRLKVVYRPQPVVGIISPWNFPLMLSLGDAIPALIAGSAVVIKPSEFTPLSLLQIVERGWKEAVGGPDVLDVVLGIGETGTALVDAVDFIQFTGSEATGKKVMARAAETLTPVSLELGGKDPMIVLADADLDRAVNAAAWGGLFNSGQICMSVERVYVEEPIYDDFVSRLTDCVSKLKQGVDGRAYGGEIGAMTSPNQTAIVERHVADARERGARIVIGGERLDGPGDFYRPTVIADVDHSMQVMRDETFGPVIPVMKVSDADEAVRLANDTTYGLSASVFSGDRSRGEAIARRIEVGACNVNDVLVNYLATDIPMGGWKSSGIGYRHGGYGIRKFCRTESLAITRFGGKRELMWFPYSRRKGRLVHFLMRFFGGRGLRGRLGRAR
jgi:acyl-CoA reductase-like NAD-dependent aldehyde dehydrogenase